MLKPGIGTLPGFSNNLMLTCSRERSNYKCAQRLCFRRYLRISAPTNVADLAKNTAICLHDLSHLPCCLVLKMPAQMPALSFIKKYVLKFPTNSSHYVSYGLLSTCIGVGPVFKAIRKTSILNNVVHISKIYKYTPMAITETAT